MFVLETGLFRVYVLAGESECIREHAYVRAFACFCVIVCASICWPIRAFIHEYEQTYGYTLSDSHTVSLPPSLSSPSLPPSLPPFLPPSLPPSIFLSLSLRPSPPSLLPSLPPSFANECTFTLLTYIFRCYKTHITKDRAMHAPVSLALGHGNVLSDESDLGRTA